MSGHRTIFKMTGRSGTQISILKNYIGMRSDANESNKDPNGSSAVINNAFLYGGKISIGGSYIIPGTAWYVFASPEPYQTAESAFAQAGEYFQIYMADGETGIVPRTYYVNADEYYNLFEKYSASSEDIIQNRIQWFKDKIEGLPGLKSGVTIEPNVPRYLLGVAVNDEDGSLITTGENNENGIKYSEVSGGLLPAVFQTKTKNFGTSDASFSDLIDMSCAMSDPNNNFYYYSGIQSVDISGLEPGIIFCDGNLTLTGSGTFTGSVICSGNLTINSGVNVEYDEATIRQVLGLDDSYTFDSTLGSKTARRFFLPGRLYGELRFRC